MISGDILIVDDHEVVRHGLRTLLSARPEWTICGEVEDGLEGVEKAKALRPTIVLMDISMPRINGLEATRIIRRELPESKVIIISRNDPAVAQRQAQEVDAHGYIAKSDLSQQLLATLDEIKNSSHVRAELPPHVPGPEWLAGGEEMSRLIRERDWSQTSLGPIEPWPQSLKTSVSICLASRFPIVLYWGPECVVLYNDAWPWW